MAMRLARGLQNSRSQNEYCQTLHGLAPFKSEKLGLLLLIVVYYRSLLKPGVAKRQVTLLERTELMAFPAAPRTLVCSTQNLFGRN